MLTAIDLFSGCGGLTLGLKQSGFAVKCAIEIDPKASAVYAANHPEVRLEVGDIRNIDASKLRKSLGLRAGALDLLAGCPPCQGFSRIRKKNNGRSARDPRNSLIDEFGVFVQVFKPRYVLLENVPGLLDYYKFKLYLGILRAEGYQTRCAILDAADFGVPQRRKRLLVVASRHGCPPGLQPSSSRMSVREAIGGLPKPGSSGDRLHDMPERRSERIANLIRAIPLNGGGRQALPESMQLACHKASDGFADVYGRMEWDNVAPTITSGCHNPSKGRFLHPQEHRTISLREASILQGFPRSYLFDWRLGKESLALMIGNALPPPFVCAQASPIARECLSIKEEL
jgi:DNA (cytosine-5)-methyltransferase 1